MMSHGFSVGRNNAEQRQRARFAQGAAQFAAGHAAARLVLPTTPSGRVRPGRTRDRK